jgi:hypothetical protein
MAASKKEDPRAGPGHASDHVRNGSGFRRAVQIPEDAFSPNEEPTTETDLAQLEHERALRALAQHRSPPPPAVEYPYRDREDDYPNAHDNDEESSAGWDAITSKTDLADEVTTTAPQPPSSAKMMASPPVVAYRPPPPQPPAARQEPLSSTKLSAGQPVAPSSSSSSSKSLPVPTPPPPPSSGHLHRALEVDIDSLARAAQGHVLPRPPTPAAIIATPPMMTMHQEQQQRQTAIAVAPPRPPAETLPLDQHAVPPPPPPMVSEREMLSLPFLPPPVVRRAFIAALQAQAPPPKRSPWLTFFVVLVSVIAIAAIAYLVLVLTGHRPSLILH